MNTLRRHGLARQAFRALVLGMVIARVAPAGDGPGGDQARERSEAPGPAAGERRPHEPLDDPVARELPEPPPAVQRTPLDDPTGEPREELSAAFVARKQYLNGYLIRDRDYRILMSSARAALERGDDDRAVEALQTIWSAPRDVLVWEDGRQHPVSVHRGADEIMRRVSNKVRETYERRFGGEAERLLELVLAHHDVEAKRNLLRRFGHTHAAARLLRHLAVRAMDRGAFDEAAGHWQRLLDDPWQHSVLNLPGTTRMLEMCEQHRLPASTLTVSGAGGLRTSVPIQDPLWTRRYMDDAANRDELIRLASGSSSDGIVADLETVVSTWAARRRNDRLPMGAASAAVVTGDMVVVRDFEGVAAYGVARGDVRWRFQCESSLCGTLSDRSQNSDNRSHGNRRRPSESELFGDTVADHSILAKLTTDGERLYLIDGSRCDEIGDQDVRSSADRVHSVKCNRLVALMLSGPDQGRPTWTRGGCREDRQSELRNFYFLGPPQPYDGDLYVIGEQNEELQTVVLDATTGQVRWKQSISLVDGPVAECEMRSRTVCLPLLDQGVVVCPTQLPVLIGLDAITGNLLWVYHAHGEERPDSFVWPRQGGRSEPEREDSQPVIAGNRILFLPRNSSMLHCIDLRSGRKLWCVDADRARFVACVDDGLVLLVNSQECIGLNLENGDLQWRTPIDAPAGRGVVAGEAYLLPLNSGRLAEIRLTDGAVLPDLLAVGTGSSTNWDTESTLPERFCGNLAIHEDLVICSSPTGLTVFPQARPLLDQLQSTQDAGAAVTAENLLRRAQLHMELGEWSAAIDVLRTLLSSGPQDAIRRSGVEHLRELLYVEIEQNPTARLEELADLVSTPDETARFLVHRLKHELNHRWLEAAAGTASEIRDLRLESLIRMDHAGRYSVRPLEQARFALEQFTAEADERDRQRIRVALRRVLIPDGEDNPERLRDAVSLLRGCCGDNLPLGNLARLLRAEGERQSAEAVLLSQHLRPAGPVETDPAGILISSRRDRTATWAEHSLPRPPPQAHGEYLVAYRPYQFGHGVELAEFREPRAVRPVEIKEFEHPLESELPDASPTSRFAHLLGGKSHFLNASGSPVRVLETVNGYASESVGRFAVIADDGITELGAIELPPARWQLCERPPYNTGHLLPLRGKGVLMLSLLEHRSLWHVLPESNVAGRGPELGPFGIDFCTLQTGQQLTVVDSVSGEPLWTRRGLRYGSGLPANEQTGIIGDHRVLVVFDANLSEYESFETRSGASLGRGKLPAAGSTRHLASFGRRLMYRTEIDGVARIRIWDPLHRRLLLDVPVEGRCLWSGLCDQQRVAILTGHYLKCVDATTGHCCWELDVSGEHLEHVRKVKLFRHGGVDLVLLERHMRDSPSNTSGLDIRLPWEELSGELYALDRTTGAPLWTAPLSVHPSKLLRIPHLSLPYLVTVSRVRDAEDSESYRLRIDVIDVGTGSVLGSRSDLTITPILHADCNPDDHTITLCGPDRRFEIVNLQDPGRQD